MKTEKEHIAISNEQSQLQVDPLGARIMALAIEGMPVLVTVTRADGKVGATHPCTPNFGKEEPDIFHLAQHGPARNVVWNVVEKTDNRITFQYEIDQPGYPKGVVVTRSMQLTAKSFTLSLIHAHRGDTPAPLNYGEHCYFHTGHFGWNTLQINGISVAELIEANATVPLERENCIRFPGNDRDLILAQDGFSLAMLWAAAKDGMFDTNYVCIEPIEGDPKTFWHTEKSILYPNEKRIHTLTIGFF